MSIVINTYSSVFYNSFISYIYDLNTISFCLCLFLFRTFILDNNITFNKVNILSKKLLLPHSKFS